MNIFLTNDDGVYSPGLAAAAEAASAFGDVYIAAPSRQKTGTGRSLIGNRDQHLEKTEIEINGLRLVAYHMDCTPALVVKHAYNTVFRNLDFDLAVSGINYGENIGYDITMSGTVGAAIEHAIRGIPAFAVSVQTAIENHFHYGEVNWNTTQYFLSLFIRRCIERQGFDGFDILKIDVPEDAERETEWALTRLSSDSHFTTTAENVKDNTKLSEIKVTIIDKPWEEGTDAYALLSEKKVSVTPLNLDWTAKNTGAFFD
jgi:5'/3'-nucleotidase